MEYSEHTTFVYCIVYYALTRLLVDLDLLVDLSQNAKLLLATTLLIMFYMLSKTLDFCDTSDVNAHGPLTGCFQMNKPHSEVSDTLTKRLCKTNVFSPWTYPVIKEFPMFRFFPSCSGLSGPWGRVMMSWSGGGRGEKG